MTVRRPEIPFLPALPGACCQFLTDTQAIEQQDISVADMWQGGINSWLLNQAIGVLRARIGTIVAVVVATFDIDVDEHLAKIMPPLTETKPVSHSAGTASGRAGAASPPHSPLPKQSLDA